MDPAGHTLTLPEMTDQLARFKGKDAAQSRFIVYTERLGARARRGSSLRTSRKMQFALGEPS